MFKSNAKEAKKFDGELRWCRGRDLFGSQILVARGGSLNQQTNLCCPCTNDVCVIVFVSCLVDQTAQKVALQLHINQK